MVHITTDCRSVIYFIVSTFCQQCDSATTLPLEIFTQRNFVVEFIRFKLIFIHKNDKFTFLSHPLGDLGVTYALHLWLVGKGWPTYYSR